MNIKIDLEITPAQALVDLVNKIVGDRPQATVAPTATIPQNENSEQEPEKRKRRTKAEIETDKAGEDVKQTLHSEEAPKTEEKTEEPKETTVTLAVLQTITRQKAQEGKREAIMALLKEFGVGKVSELAIADFATFHTKLQEV
jgi:hypothetical protein